MKGANSFRGGAASMMFIKPFPSHPLGALAKVITRECSTEAITSSGLISAPGIFSMLIPLASRRLASSLQKAVFLQRNSWARLPMFCIWVTSLAFSVKVFAALNCWGNSLMTALAVRPDGSASSTSERNRRKSCCLAWGWASNMSRTCCLRPLFSIVLYTSITGI